MITYEYGGISCRFDSETTGYLGGKLRFEIRDRHILFFDESDRQVFPDPVFYPTVRRFVKIKNNQLNQLVQAA